MSAPKIAIATNNGDIGGGEVMLLNISQSLRELGIEPLVIAPTGPNDLLVEAMSQEFETVALSASGRRHYMASLAAWRLRNLDVPLWCNGLVPSAATAGMGPRIVHLHMAPRASHRAAVAAGRLGSRAVLVPSQHVARGVAGSRVLRNWTEATAFAPRPLPRSGPVTVGYLGRLTLDKGIDVLARAMRDVAASGLCEVRLLVAGESRFGTARDELAVDRTLDELGGTVDRRGWMDRDEFFRTVDLVVFPSVAAESFGLVAAEAMAAGVPVIVSDAGALPEVVGPDHPWITRRGDPLHLSQTINAVIASESHEAVVSSARRRWEQRYSPDAGTRGVAELLQDISAPPSPLGATANRRLRKNTR